MSILIAPQCWALCLLPNAGCLLCPHLSVACPICLLLYSSPVSLRGCGHSVDRECALQAHFSGCFDRCCVCQAVVEEGNLLFGSHSNRALLSIVESHLADSDDALSQHKERVAAAESARELRDLEALPVRAGQTEDHTLWHLLPFGVAFLAVPLVLCLTQSQHGSTQPAGIARDW